MALVINVDKAKEISHDMRRSARNSELAPLDAVIAWQIPGVLATEAEAQRVVIREKYADVQISIDAATNIAELKEIVKEF